MNEGSHEATDKQKTTLLIGFDSAWTAQNSGAIIGVLRSDDGTFCELGPPQIADYRLAQAAITAWQVEFAPEATIILLDQPTIVPNATGQRPVENIVGAIVGLRYGGMQPANTSKMAMFGAEAPIWPFLNWFDGTANPLEADASTNVFETYPVLTMIALNWTQPDLSPQGRPAGRLPKYNPERNKTFSLSDWQYVCGHASAAFSDRGLMEIVQWIDGSALKAPPRKCDQDGLDACICLLVALHLAEGKDCLMVGDLQTGYIVVPHSVELHTELDIRCNETGRVPSEWVQEFRLAAMQTLLATKA
jgi:predicted RNase H-like nuclease